MKTNTIRMLGKCLTVLCLSLLSFAGFSQHTGTLVNMQITNLVQLTPSSFQYDVTLTNTGTTSLSLRGYSWGLNTNPSFATGGTITQTFVTRDAGLAPLFPAVTLNSATANHLRATTINAAAGLEYAMTPNVPVLLGRVTVTKSVPFPANYSPFAPVAPTAILQVTTLAGRTQCVATCIITSMVVPTSFALFGVANPPTATSLNYLTSNTAAAAAFVMNGVTCTPVVTTSSATACDSYTWTANNATYTTSGQYIHTVAQAGVTPPCIDTNILNLTINNSSTSSETAAACDSYTWAANGTTYTASGAYTHTSLNAAGCVNTATLNLTINMGTSTSSSVTACDFYTWSANGTTYAVSGTYTHTSLSAAGCVNTETLNLTINNSSVSVMSETACDSYTWAANGTTYTASGSYTHTTQNTVGCVNTATLNLTINASTSASSSATACDSYTWMGTTYTASGMYSMTSTNAAGCLHTDMLNLTINASTTSTTTASTCISYTWAENGQSYTASGTYTHTSLNAAGCVNTATLNLTITPATGTTTTVTACDSYTWSSNNVTYTASGSYTNSGACGNDVLDLTINASSSSSLSATSCNSYTWSENGNIYTASGTYTHTSLNAAGCVNTATLILTINMSTTSALSATACDSYTWSENATTYTASGTYTAISTNAAGCVHIAVLTLTINNSSSASSSATACDSYTWMGNTYTASGMYSVTSTNAAGCTHTDNLNLTINASTSSSMTAAACGSYTWSENGATYTASGTYTATSLNAAGCTNTATLNLTINNGVNTSATVNSAGPYTWAVNGVTYTASGVYTATTLDGNGCVATSTLNLTISSGPCSFTLLIEEDQPISCNGNNDASLQATASPSGTYSYSVTDILGNVIATNSTGYFDMLTPGTHTVTATQGGCTVSGTIFYINPDPLDITFCTDSMVSCNGNDGVLSIVVTGGTANLQDYLTWWTNTANPTDTLNDVLLDNFATSLDSLPAGNYNVSIEDDHGCFYNETAPIQVAAAVVAMASSGGILCAGGTAAIVPSGTGGVMYLPTCVNTQSTLTFMVNGAPYVAGTMHAAGTYTITATDAKGCSATTTLTLTDPPPTNSTSSVTACDMYTWSANGMTYTASGTYTATSVVAGCLTQSTLILTINNSTTTSTSYSWCDQYTWPANGVTYTASGVYTHTSLNAAGCVNTATLNLTINYTTVSVTCCVNSCGPYTWNGQVYTVSGSYYVITQNAAGCPHVAVLCLTVNNPTASSESATACGSYTWAVNGQTYTATGMYTATSLNAAGCVHTTTLNLTLSAGTTTNSSATACDTYTWTANNTAYTVSGMYTYTALNTSGCVDTWNLNLTINNSTSSSMSATACDTYTWAENNATYTMGGTYVHTSLNAAGCTHTATLTLTINASTSSSMSATACDTYTWAENNATYTMGGTYVHTSLNAAGCTHTATLTLTINASTTSSMSATACDSYTWAENNATYTMGGTYVHTSLNAAGCTHTATLTLTINASTSSSMSATACDTYTWAENNATYTMGGTYVHTSLNAAGCLHTATLMLTINASTSSSMSATACDTYTWAENNATYTMGGTYVHTSLNAAGCTHTATLTLTINASTSSTMSATACDTYTWAENNATYTMGGTYVHTSLNAAGCLHTATLMLTINASTSSSMSATACDTYTWAENNATYTMGGTYVHTSLNAAGCTHTATLTLTINASTSSSMSATACDTYTWAENNATYTMGGTYVHTSLNAAGCTHTATLTLTINASTSSTMSATACDSYTWAENNATYTMGGTYVHTSLNAAGCTHTATLNLTINASTANTVNTTQCNAYVWSTGNGNTYTMSGMYTHTTLNAAGCVHTTTLNLTINYGTSSSNSVTTCDPYTWAANGTTYSVGGTYVHTLVGGNSAGCDSVATLILTFNNGVSVRANAMLCGALDATTGLMKDSLRRVTHMQAPFTLPSDGQFVTGSPVNVISTVRGKLPTEKLCAADADTMISAAVLASMTNYSVASNGNSIVDWIMLEIRNGADSNLVVASKYGLVQRDGDIVSAVDGTSPLMFSCVCPGDYYVAVKHRNHLGVMTMNKITLSAIPSAVIPFSDPSFPVWNKAGVTNGARANVVSTSLGNFAPLWGGDANTNKNAKYNGLSNDKDRILIAVAGSLTPAAPTSNNIIYQAYRTEDLNMDGKVRYNNYDNDKNWLLNKILSSVPSATPNEIISQHTPN